MSITASETDTVLALPPAPVGQHIVPLIIGSRCIKITRRYTHVGPTYDEFRIYDRNGELCTKHPNGGGLVALSARVELTVLVEEGAAILGHAVVRGDVRVEDQSIIDGNATVSGQSRLREHSRVSGHAILEGRVLMRHRAHVGGNAHLRGMISLEYGAFVGDESRLFGNMHLE